MPKRIAVLTAVLLLAGAVSVEADPAGNRPLHRLQSAVVAAAGGPGASGAAFTAGSAGQPSPPGIATGAGRVLYAGFWRPLSLLPTAVDPLNATDFRNALLMNQPNPFRASTRLAFTLARDGAAELKIFDIAGRCVRTLVSEHAARGLHVVDWNGRDDAGLPAASGIYFYRVTSGAFVSSGKMMLVR